MTVVEYWTPGVFIRIFSTFSSLIRALQRSGIGELHVDIEIALVFVGQKARGHARAKKAGRTREDTSSTTATALLRISPPHNRDVAIRSRVQTRG